MLEINQVKGLPTTTIANSVKGPGGRTGLMPEAQLYVATPALLRFYGIAPTAITPGTDVITSRSGLSGMKILDFGTTKLKCPAGSAHCPAPGRSRSGGGVPDRRDLATPAIQVLGLAKYSSAPNTLLTAHAMAALALHPVLAAWLIQTPKPADRGAGHAG